MTQQSSAVNFGDEFYLKSENDLYLIDAYSGTFPEKSYNWPRLGTTGRIKFKIDGGNGVLKNGNDIQIKSMESNLGDKNILGAFGDSHDCYYWDDYDKKKQGWKTEKVERGDDEVHYGDKVYLTNLSYKGQKLIMDNKFDGYISTKKRRDEFWILESLDSAEATQFDSFVFDVGKKTFSTRNAYWLAEAAKLAYEDEMSIKTKVNSWGLDSFEFFDNKTTDTQAFVAGNRELTIVAFRGTQEAWDIVKDLQMIREGGIHRGFKGAFDSVWSDMVTTIERFPAAKIWVTGHSLGAALATLAADKLLDANLPIVGLYTFGSPRVANTGWAEKFNAKFKSSTFRFANNNDVVTRVPPRSGISATHALQYSHVGSLRYFDSETNMHEELSSWNSFLDKVRGRIEDVGVAGTDGMNDHFMDGYVERVRRQLKV